MNDLNFYNIDLKYIRNLAKSDDNVMSISPQIQKANRPFLGVIVLINYQQYCIPLTSPKPKFLNKKSSVDFIKIFDNKQDPATTSSKIIGILNINNMIPVNKFVIHKVHLEITKHDSLESQRYKTLMQKQLAWCREHSETIYSRANKVYSLVINFPEKNRNLTRRCVDFRKAEEVLAAYHS